METQIIKHIYKATKFNKCDIQYEITHPLPPCSPLTERVKIEAFQGFSNAYNLGEYFRLRGTTNWKDGKKVTGLWKTENKDIFYGDNKTSSGKSLIIFKFENNRETVSIYTFPDCYYPSRNIIDNLIGGVK